LVVEVMCWSCVVSEFVNAGLTPEQVEITPEMDRLAGAIWAWYQMPGNEAGGVLHVVTDDFNIDDHSLDFCSTFEAESLDAEYAEARDFIIDGMRVLSIPERALVVWHGFVSPETRRVVK